MGFKRSRVQIPAARFSDAWENFFGLKRFAETAGVGMSGSSQGVRKGLARADGDFSFCCKALAGNCEKTCVITAD